jgi:hypothetical protein
MIVIKKITVVTKRNSVLYETAYADGMWIPRVNDTISITGQNLWHVQHVVWLLQSNSLDVIVEPQLGLLE